MRENNNFIKFTLITIISLVMQNLLYKFLYTPKSIEIISKWIGGYNIGIYSFGLIVFVLLFLTLFFWNKLFFLIQKNYIWVGVFSAFFISWSLVFVNLEFVLNFNVGYGFYVVPRRLLVLFILLGLVLILYLLSLQRKNDITIKKVLNFLKLLVSIIAVIWYFYAHYEPNYLKNNYSIIHSDAVFNPVYNAVMGEPYSNVSCGMYGQYGLILSLLFKIIGFSTEKYMWFMNILYIIVLVLLIYDIVSVIENDIVQIFAIAALPLAGGVGTVTTYQGLIRICCPIFFISFLVYITKHDLFKRRRNMVLIIGFFISIMSIVWNKESGIMVAFTFAVFYVYMTNLGTGLSLKIIKHIIISVIGVICAFLFAWGWVSVWNLFHGGNAVSLDTFLIPLGNRTFMVQSHQMTIDNFNVPWKHVVILFCIFVALGIWNICVKKPYRYSTMKLGIFFCVAILSLGCMTYFINRPVAGNLYIVYYQIVVLLAAVADYCFCYYKVTKGNSQQIAKGVGVSFLSLLLILGMFNVLNIYHTRGQRDYKWADTEYRELLTDISENVESNTPAIGRGVDILYGSLGWDTVLHIPDDTGLTEELKLKVKENIVKPKTKLFLAIGTLRSFANAYCDFEMDDLIDRNYNILNKFYLNDIEFWYVEPKEYSK